MGRVVTLGWACLDRRYWVEAFPPTASRTECTALATDLGGPAAVAALTAARLGGEAAFVGRRGADEAGGKLMSKLSDEDVDVRWFQSTEGAQTPESAILIAPNGNRHIFRYAGNLPDEPDWLTRMDLEMTDADVALVDLRWTHGVRRLFEQAGTSGARRIVDFDDPSATGWSLVERATHAIADAETSHHVGNAAALLDRLRGLDTWGAVTLGADGGQSHAGPVPVFPVTVADSTGAGDVFHGAFALALAEGQEEAEALRFASAAAALRCRNADVPHRSELEEFLEAHHEAHAG
ncbi:MAG: PfkB family carbohydrate kinase [Candidatus Bipolaricaulia bacterium]